MALTKKKIVQIFSDGSLNINTTFLKKSGKIKIGGKDHTTFTFNRRNLNLVMNSKSFENFKTKYLKF